MIQTEQDQRPSFALSTRFDYVRQVGALQGEPESHAMQEGTISSGLVSRLDMRLMFQLRRAGVSLSMFRTVLFRVDVNDVQENLLEKQKILICSNERCLGDRGGGSDPQVIIAHGMGGNILRQGPLGV